MLNLDHDQLIQLGIVIALAAAPAIIWTVLIFKGRKTSRWPLLLAFFLGTLTVIPLMALEYLWIWFPSLDIYRAIELNISEVHAAAFASLVIVGALEELTKSGVVRIINKTKIGIQTINDAVKYSILAGLGFAFVENIFYFYFIWQSSGFVGLLFPMIFRSVITVCAHMVFSGIFGYFYGLAKFSKPILETKLWMGQKAKGTHFMSKILGSDEAAAYRQTTLLKGLFIAMGIHAFFNFFLEFEYFLPVIALIGAGFAYLLYLLAHKAGAIAFSGSGRKSSMAKKDQDVVLELLGMWTKEGRYNDVVDICQRLLMRDPDNRVVKLFQAKAMDKQKLANLEDSLAKLFTSDEGADTDASIRTLVKQKVLMEMLKEKQSKAAAPTPSPTKASQQAAQPAAPPAQSAPKIPNPTPGPSAPQSDQSSQQ